MVENIASRVGRLISGTANMLVEAVENAAPEMIMEEAVREIDRAIDDVRAELGLVISRQHMATRRLAGENSKHNDLTDKIQIALKEDREDLAEAAVSQILDIEAQIPVLEGTITEAKDAQTELEGYITALQARKREMKSELSEFHASKDAFATSGPSGENNSSNINSSNSVERNVQNAEDAFDRALEGAGGVGGLDPTPGKIDAAKRAELDDLARQNRISERLEAFKSKGA